MKELNIDLRKSLLVQKKSLKKVLEEIIEKLSTGHWVEKRKKWYNFEDFVEIMFCKTII